MPWVRDPAFKKMHAGDLFEIGDMAGARKFVADVLADDELGTFSPDGRISQQASTESPFLYCCEAAAIELLGSAAY